MNAISALSSFNFRAGQGASLPSAQQAQAQRGSFNSAFNSGVGAARGSTNASGGSSAICPGCAPGGSSSARGGASSSFCPTCNQAGGRQANVTNFNSQANANTARTGAAQAGAAHSHQGGRICVGCAYQGR